MRIEQIKNLEDHVPKQGIFVYKHLRIIVTKDVGKWHLSVSVDGRIPNYEEMKLLRYSLLPKNIYAAEIFPPPEEFVNLNPYTRHLFEIDK